MKKSKLRKIIRESIKGLMTEQSPAPNGNYPYSAACIIETLTNGAAGSALSYYAGSGASSAWTNNTITTFSIFGCNKTITRRDHFTNQMNSGQFQGNNLARKTAKRNTLAIIYQQCCYAPCTGSPAPCP